MKKPSNLPLILRFLRGSRALFLLCMVSAALTGLADMLNPQIIRIAVDNVLRGEAGEIPPLAMGLIDRFGGIGYLGENIWIMALWVGAVALLRAVFQYLFRLSNTMAAEKLTKTMRDSLFSHIQHLPYEWHMKHRTGDIIQRCTADIETMKGFVSEQLTSILRIIMLLALSIVFMLGMNVKLTVIALLPIPAIIVRSFRFHRKMSDRYLKCDENEGILSDIAQENLTGVRVVRAFGRERHELDKFRDHNRYYTSLWEGLARIMSRFWATADILSGIEIMLVVVFGAVFCVRGSMLPGEYIAFISYNSMLVWPVRMLGRMIAEMSKAGVSVERIAYIMRCETEKEPPNAKTPPMDGDIAFENVSFAYDGGRDVLKNVSFGIKSGTTLGILGGTGSGKSTLMLLLDKLYDLPESGGRITVGGVDIREISTEYLRKNIGMVLQEPYLFSRSIFDNIAIADKSLTADRVEAAAKAACLHDSIMGFSAGYGTFVGERGVTLSGGQKQRTAIARTLVGKAPILVFDDSLSAVDAETDAKIRAALESRFGSATVILISHRISTLSRADNIIVLDRGRIVQQGSHAELSAQEGIYREIYRIQTGREEAENE